MLFVLVVSFKMSTIVSISKLNPGQILCSCVIFILSNSEDPTFFLPNSEDPDEMPELFVSLSAGDKNSTCPLVIRSEIWEGRVILPKAIVLQDECFGKNYSIESYYILLSYVLYCLHF